MGYALSAFLVPQDTILRFPGCADDTLLNEMLPAVQERLADLDEQLVDEDDITHEQAFRELFSGEITAEHYGARYGWAFETLCGCLGTYLSNYCFSPCTIAWYEQLDDYLATTDTALRFDDLINNCPIRIPMSDDWPVIGHWSHQQIINAAPYMSKLATAASDHDVAEALRSVNDWFNEATKDPNLFIVGFHG